MIECVIFSKGRSPQIFQNIHHCSPDAKVIFLFNAAVPNGSITDHHCNVAAFCAFLGDCVLAYIGYISFRWADSCFMLRLCKLRDRSSDKEGWIKSAVGFPCQLASKLANNISCVARLVRSPQSLNQETKVLLSTCPSVGTIIWNKKQIYKIGCKM